MLSYFPEIYSGELLYSVVARYHRHVGSPAWAHILETLFGCSRVVSNFDLPGGLHTLAERIPPSRELNTAEIVRTLTLYPYFTAFEPPSLQTKIMRAMQYGEVEKLHLLLGIAAFRVGQIKILRFCPECVLTMRVNLGELYWRREHQLASVLVCPEHGCPLMESGASLIQQGRHEFVAATLENCSSNSRPVAKTMDREVLSQLQELARLSANLLDHPPAPKTLAKWTEFYRNQMLAVGLTYTANRMNQQRFEEEFSDFYGRTLTLLSRVVDCELLAGDWLAAMVRKHRKANHPLYHLLVQNFLAHQESQISPFGVGPWRCLNPLAKHNSSTPITEMTQHRNRGNRVGVFTCSCGYAYTRCFDEATNTLGPTRFLRYGALLEPTLRKLIESGASLRKIGGVLRVDPKTVVRLAREVDLAVPWKRALHKRRCSQKQNRDSIQKKSKQQSLHNQLPPVSKKGNCHARHDWTQIDREWADTLPGLVARIREEAPPVRITIAELERRAGSKNWLLKRRCHLPQTVTLLYSIVESVKDFQDRRISWGIAELAKIGHPIKAWQVMRKVGLHSDSLRPINEALEVALDNNNRVSTFKSAL